MRNALFLALILSLLLCACTDEKTKLQESIAAMEEQVEQSKDPELTNQLIEAYRNYVNAYPGDHVNNGRYLYRLAGLLYAQKRYTGAANAIKQALKDHYNSDATSAAALLLGTIYKENLKNDFVAATVYQAFLQAFPQHEKAEAIRKDYGNLPPFSERLKALADQLLDTVNHRINYQVANDFVNACEVYAFLLPDDPKTPEFAHKAGEMARSVSHFARAVELYDWVYNRYPDHPKAPQALFMKAFIYSDDLKDTAKARQAFEEFLARFPDDGFADDAQFLLDNLGKPDEEIIKSFEANQQ